MGPGHFAEVHPIISATHPILINLINSNSNHSFNTHPQSMWVSYGHSLGLSSDHRFQ